MVLLPTLRLIAEDGDPLLTAMLFTDAVASASCTVGVTVTEVVVEMSQSLLHFSVSGGEPNPATVRELKRMLRAYLRAVARGA